MKELRRALVRDNVCIMATNIFGHSQWSQPVRGARVQIQDSTWIPIVLQWKPGAINAEMDAQPQQHLYMSYTYRRQHSGDMSEVVTY